MIQRLGMTGSRLGTTLQQRAGFMRLLRELQIKGLNEYHHGLCIGADEQMHALAFEMEVPIVGHPPTRTDQMMVIHREEFVAMREPLPYLVRNRAIVQETDALVGLPSHTETQRGSGTWHTIRWAHKLERPVAIIWPWGETAFFRWPEQLLKPEFNRT
jgi:hypothetical protein